jgi:hypothetical protein
MTRLKTILVGVAAVGAGLVAAPATAYAGDGQLSVDVGSGWAHDLSSPLFDIANIAPGWTQATTFRVRNGSDSAAALTLGASGIFELENGCMHSEAAVDPTCGADQGELGQELQLSVYTDADDTGVFAGTPSWTGTVHDLSQAAVVDRSLLPGGVEGIRLVASLPPSSGNETQSDRLDFRLRLTLDGVGSVSVLGTKTVRSSTRGGLGGVLPFTGTPSGQLMLGAAWLLLVGGALLAAGRLGRTRRRTSHAESPVNP